MKLILTFFPFIHLCRQLFFVSFIFRPPFLVHQWAVFILPNSQQIVGKLNFASELMRWGDDCQFVRATFFLFSWTFFPSDLSSLYWGRKNTNLFAFCFPVKTVLPYPVITIKLLSFTVSLPLLTVCFIFFDPNVCVNEKVGLYFTREQQLSVFVYHVILFVGLRSRGDDHRP